MRFAIYGPLSAALLTLVIATSSWALQATHGSISGRLIYTYGPFDCQPCEVRLETSGERPVATTYADTAGAFTFHGVPRGSYVVRVQIEGLQDVVHPVEMSHLGHANEVIYLQPDLIVIRQEAQQGDQQIVHVSQFLRAYPPDAVKLYEDAVKDRKRGRIDQAIKQFEEAVALAPDFYHAHNDLGVLYKETGRIDDAERHFLRAFELSPVSVEPLVNLSSLYIAKDEPERAVSIGEQAVETNSRSASAFFNLGVALYKLSRLDRAEAALQRALELAPKMPEIRLLLANLYMKMQRPDRLLEQLERFIDENPKSAEREKVEQMRQQLLEEDESAREAKDER